MISNKLVGSCLDMDFPFPFDGCIGCLVLHVKLDDFMTIDYAVEVIGDLRRWKDWLLSSWSC